MRETFSVEATIAETPGTVWATLVDWSRAQHWMSGIDWMRAEGATAPGTTVTFHTRGKSREATIAAVNPGRSITLRSVQGGVVADYVYGVEPVESGSTRVTLVASCEADGLWWKLLYPVIRLAIRWTDGGQMNALKKLVEGGGRESGMP